MSSTSNRLAPVHPGAILLHDFLEPLGLSQNRLARDISVPLRRINEIVHAKRAVTANTALRLATFFDTSAQFWMNLQARYDLETAEDASGETIRRQVGRSFRDVEAA